MSGARVASFLIVGAGFAGAVYARTLADAGHRVTVVDKRGHIGGNAFDYVDDSGVRVHRYGPHLFHTNNETVVEWIKRFGEWLPYEHRVRARLSDGRHVPLPINRDTINQLFDKSLADPVEVQEFLKSLADPIENPRNAAEYLRSQIGELLTDLFFRPYTKKMWSLDLEDMSSSVVKRIPIRFDQNDRYFPDDRFQLLPANGYTAIFENIFDHPGIEVTLNTAYARGMEVGYEQCFNSMPIDEFYGSKLGELPYRSIRFHSSQRPAAPSPGWAVTNYTDNGPFTRETSWSALPGHVTTPAATSTVTVEEPCDYRDNEYERYYPVKTADDRYVKLYEQYKHLAEDESSIQFIGRCGTYQYLDMHQVINQSLLGVSRFLQEFR
jgi:UDP-galactopyranose mutase